MNADGTADNGFGGGGISDPLSSAATALDIINDVAVDTDDNIVFAGGRTDSAVAAQDWLLARYLGN